MNEIEAELAGTIVEVFAQNGKPVEFGQKLFRSRRPEPAQPPSLFKKILIANRGEIALRIIRACRELGIATVAVHSEADARALHVRFADEAVCIGPAPRRQELPAHSRDHQRRRDHRRRRDSPRLRLPLRERRVRAALREVRRHLHRPDAGGDARVGRQGRARASDAKRFGLPLLPGSERPARRRARRRPRPSASASRSSSRPRGGGGGRGMRIVREAERGRGARSSRRRARPMAGFKNPDVYLEKFVERPRHIEFQVARRQARRRVDARRARVLAPAPPPEGHRRGAEPGDDPRAARRRWARSSGAPIRETGYTSLGTLEFIMDEDGKLYFLEMNTRVQVEHPVTEMVTGLDLVAQQIRVAAGEKLELPDTRPWSFRGHAIECRINAEDPETFAPWPGLITEYYPPGGAGVRVDSGVYGGWRVPPALRLAPREGHRPRADARRGDRPHAPRARRVHRRRHPHEHRAAQAAAAPPEVAERGA